MTCDFFGQIWYEIYNWLRVVSTKTTRLKDHLLLFRLLGGFSKNIYYAFYVIWLSCVWIIRRDKNARVFNKR